MNAKVVEKTIHVISKFIIKKAPYILSALAGAGTVVVATTAVEGYRELEDDISEYEKSEGKEPEKQDKIIMTTHAYRKAIISIALTLTCIGGSVFIFNRRIRNYKSTINFLEVMIKRYSEAATATLGVEATKLMNKKIAENSANNMIIDALTYEDGDELFYDPIFDYWFTANKFVVQEAITDIDRYFGCNMEASVRRFYDYMMIDPPGCRFLEWEDPMTGKMEPMEGFGWYMDDLWMNKWAGTASFIGAAIEGPYTLDDGTLEYNVISYEKPPYYTEDVYYSLTA